MAIFLPPPKPANIVTLYTTSAPIGCASSKGLLIINPASPGALQLCAHNVFYEGAISRRYRLTKDFDDVHLQLIIEIAAIQDYLEIGSAENIYCTFTQCYLRSLG
eukprot:sb/3477960/